MAGGERMIRVLLVEDPWVKQGSLKAMIENNREIQVVGCAGNVREAFELCGRLAPDVVLMNTIMPGCDGIQGTLLIKTKYQSVKALILTSNSCHEYVWTALSNGADGFLPDDTPPGISLPHIATPFITMTMGNPAPSNNPVYKLADREREIIRYIVEGKNNREISRILYLSEGRVKNLITGILKKLGVKGRVQLVVYAVKQKLV